MHRFGIDNISFWFPVYLYAGVTVVS